MARALGQGIVEVPNSGEAYAALAQLNSRLERLESVRANGDGANLDDFTRDHYVCYGAALLHSPVDLSQCASDEPVVLSYEDLRQRVDCLCDWLRLLKLTPLRIFLMDDADSIIVGRAVAAQLATNFEIAHGDSHAHSRSLFISADSRKNSAASLRTVFPGQVLYSLNLHRETGSIAPDVASFACGQMVFPWRGKPLSPRKVTGFVENICNAPLRSTNAEWVERLEFFRARRHLLVAGNSKFRRLQLLPSVTTR